MMESTRSDASIWLGLFLYYTWFLLPGKAVLNYVCERRTHKRTMLVSSSWGYCCFKAHATNCWFSVVFCFVFFPWEIDVKDVNKHMKHQNIARSLLVYYSSKCFKFQQSKDQIMWLKRKLQACTRHILY